MVRTATTQASPADSSHQQHGHRSGSTALITNQFAAEFGRAAGSVVNVVTTERDEPIQWIGVLFHNDEGPERAEQSRQERPVVIGTVTQREPVGRDLRRPRSSRDRTFFFGSFQRWTDRQLGSGFTLNGAPTEAGPAGPAVRSRIAAAGTGAAQVRARRQRPTGKTANFTVERPDHSPFRSVRLTGSSSDRAQQQSGDGARSIIISSAEPHADRPLPFRPISPKNSGNGPGHAPGPDDHLTRRTSTRSTSG